MRRFDYVPVGPPSRALTPDLSDPPLYPRHPLSVGVQRPLQVAQGPVERVATGHFGRQPSKGHYGNGYIRNCYCGNSYYRNGDCAILSDRAIKR